MNFTFSHRGSGNVFLTLFSCGINVETWNSGKRLGCKVRVP